MLRKVFVDMDGVLVDFDGYIAIHGLRPVDVKKDGRHYFRMLPIQAGLDAVARIAASSQLEVWLATKPPRESASAWGAKAKWVQKHLPGMLPRLIITSDKGILGGEQDFLIDDRPHKGNCRAFRGKLIEFDGSQPELSWARALTELGVGHG